MSKGNWIKLHRKITRWGWYSDTNTFRVFVHLLLTASYEENEYRGHKIMPGQCVTGRKKLAKDLGMSEQSVRTSLEHLKSTNEITIKPTNRFSIITIEKWGEYQLEFCESTNEVTNQSPNKQPTTNHTQEGKEIKNINTINSISASAPSYKEKIIEEWNRLPLPDIKAINQNSNREKSLTARVKEFGLDAVLDAIKSIADSSFLLGQNNRNWTITFDWFIRPNNFPKVYEGNYLNKTPAGEESKFDISDNDFTEIMERHKGVDQW